MASARRALITLARRADFLRIAGRGAKWATAGLVLQACPQPAPSDAPGRDPSGANVSATPTIRVGFTASKKVGGAVVRNRARRRLRALAREVLAREAQPGYDYVLIARAETATRDYADLQKDVRFALKRLRLLKQQPEGPPKHAGGVRR
jgi:ribonuclease P protein component